MKTTAYAIALALILGLAALLTAAPSHAAAYSGNPGVGVYAANPVCRDGATVYRIKLTNTTPTRHWMTQTVTLVSGHRVHARDMGVTLYPDATTARTGEWVARHSTTASRIRVNGDSVVRYAAAYRGEVLYYRTLADVC